MSLCNEHEIENKISYHIIWGANEHGVSATGGGGGGADQGFLSVFFMIS